MKIKTVYIAILAIMSINSITYAKTYKAEINIDLNDPSTYRQSGTFKEYFDANDMLNVDAALAERQFMQDINSGKYELWHTAEPGWNQSSWGRWKYCNHRDIYREMAGELY